MSVLSDSMLDAVATRDQIIGLGEQSLRKSYFPQLQQQLEQLREERDFSAAILDSLPGVFYLYDENGRFKRWNKNFERVTGYSAAEMALRHPLDFFTATDKPLLTVRIAEVFEKGVSDAEADFVAKDGTRTPYYFTGLRVEFGGKPHLLGVGIDVAARKRAEESLRRSEARFRVLVEHMNDGVLVADLQTQRFVMANPAMARMLGCTADELVQRTVADIHRAADLPRVLEAFEKLARGEITLASDVPVHHVDGSLFWADVSAAPFEMDGRPSVLGVFRDVTERKKAEEAIRQSQKHLRDLIDNTGAYVFVGLLTIDGTVIETNRSSLEAAGLKPEDVVGQPFEETYWWAYSEEVQRQLHEAITRAARGEPSRYDVQIRVAEDQFIIIDFSLRPLRDETGKVVFLVPSANVITERKQAEEALRRAHDELERRVEERTAQLAAKNEELKGFAYTVSHDLKAPLRGIAGYASELDRKHRGGLSARAEFCVDQILGASRSLDRLIEDLLHYSRLDTTTPTITDVNLPALVEAILKDRGLAIAEKNVQLAVNVPAVTLRTWDRGLAQVLGNLIDNALKYSRAANPPCVAVWATELGRAWRIGVHDNGIGFDMKYHDRIFGLFNRLVREDQFEGTGAGLAIVKKVLDKLHGRVWAESTPGQGATFYVELPKETTEVGG
jgi:PAS domain S-box-containing protein